MVTIVDEILAAANMVANEEADLLNRAADRICAQWQKLDEADKVISDLRAQLAEAQQTNLEHAQIQNSLATQLAEAQKKAVARIDELNKLNTENELLSNRVEALQEKAEALDRLEEMAGSDYLQIIGDDGILSLYQGGYWSEESTSLKDLITKAYERSKP